MYIKNYLNIYLTKVDLLNRSGMTVQGGTVRSDGGSYEQSHENGGS